jgi:hypothetical protein
MSAFSRNFAAMYAQHGSATIIPAQAANHFGRPGQAQRTADPSTTGGNNFRNKLLERKLLVSNSVGSNSRLHPLLANWSNCGAVLEDYALSLPLECCQRFQFQRSRES